MNFTMRLRLYLVALALSAATAADPSAAEVITQARALAKQPGGAAKADAMLEKAAKMDPTSGEAQMYRANIEAFLTKQSMDRAISLYKESITADGGTRWEAHYFLGKVLAGEGRHAEAAEALKAAAKLQPDNAAVLNEYASSRARTTLPVDAHGKAVPLPEDDQLFQALAKNVQDHESESATSCESFYCGEAAAEAKEFPMDKYTMGPVPSNDFPLAFSNADEQIFVSKTPLFSAEECAKVIDWAEAEGKGMKPATSGKYQIGRAWVKEMPSVLTWFNDALKTKLFPTLHHLFGDLISSPSALRAHTVLIAKYNASDVTARSDVHVDDALLALTIALSPPESFTGGGTYFEHLNTTVDMNQGHVTFRPGSVRHAGAPIDTGLRYVIGGFIAIDDKVEHVRRLVERGTRLLMYHDAGQASEEHLQYALKLFEWGLQINANCTLCHQNLGDVYLRLDRPKEAEASMRQQVALLPYEADGHFALGVALRRQGRNKEAVEAYETALNLAPTDAEGYVNLGTALSSLGEHEREVKAYRQSLKLQPDNADVWLNLGTVLITNLKDGKGALEAYRHAVSGYAKHNQYEEIASHLTELGKVSAVSSDSQLAASLKRIAGGAKKVAAAKEKLKDHAEGVCGKTCPELAAGGSLADALGVEEQKRACAMSWEEKCGGEVPPPSGFEKGANLAEVCALSCAADALEARGGSNMSRSKVVHEAGRQALEEMLGV